MRTRCVPAYTAKPPRNPKNALTCRNADTHRGGAFQCLRVSGNRPSGPVPPVRPDSGLAGGHRHDTEPLTPPLPARIRLPGWVCPARPHMSNRTATAPTGVHIAMRSEDGPDSAP